MASTFRSPVRCCTALEAGDLLRGAVYVGGDSLLGGLLGFQFHRDRDGLRVGRQLDGHVLDPHSRIMTRMIRIPTMLVTTSRKDPSELFWSMLLRRMVRVFVARSGRCLRAACGSRHNAVRRRA